MNFSREQMAAIFLLSADMVGADGRIDPREPVFVAAAFKKLGTTDMEDKQMIDDSKKMEPSKAIAIVSYLGAAEKKYVAALLTSLVAVDGEIAEKEISLLAFISTLCRLPIFNSLEEAVNYLRIC